MWFLLFVENCGCATQGKWAQVKILVVNVWMVVRGGGVTVSGTPGKGKVEKVE